MFLMTIGFSGRLSYFIDFEKSIQHDKIFDKAIFTIFGSYAVRQENDTYFICKKENRKQNLL